MSINSRNIRYEIKSNKLFIDTNIIIDALTGREPFREVAKRIFILAANQTEGMYITASSATDIYDIIRID